MKTFSLEPTAGNPKSRKRIETRFLTLHDSNEWAGYSYRWNDEQTDAFLVDKAGANVSFEMQIRQTHPHANAGSSLAGPSAWSAIPARATYVLGLQTEQMNRDHAYHGAVRNQIDTLSQLGILISGDDAQPFHGGCRTAQVSESV